MSVTLQRSSNQSRFEEIAQLHENAFNWLPQGRIPLGVHVVNLEHAQGLSYSDWLNPEPIDQRQLFLGNTVLRGQEPKVDPLLID